MIDRLTVQTTRSKTGIDAVVENAYIPVKLSRDNAVTHRAPTVNTHQILFSVCM